MADQAGGNGVRRQPAVATAPNSASASGAVTLGADVPIPAAPYYIEKLLKHNPCTEVIMWAENHSGVWVRPELTPSLRRAWGPIDVDAYIAWCTLRDKELEDARASLASTSPPTTMTNPTSSSANDSKPIVPLSSTPAPASVSTAIVAPSAPMAPAKTNPVSFQSAYSSSAPAAGRPRNDASPKPPQMAASSSAGSLRASRQIDSDLTWHQMVATIEHFVKKGPSRMGERQAGKTLPPNAGHANFRQTHFRSYFGSYSGLESPENYGLNVDNDFGLCRITWNSRNYQCEHGKDCPWRHFITSDIIEYIWRMGGRKGLDWLVSSMTALRAPGRVEHTYIPLPQGKSRRFDDGEGEYDGYSVSRPMHKRVKYGHGGW